MKKIQYFIFALLFSFMTAPSALASEPTSGEANNYGVMAQEKPLVTPTIEVSKQTIRIQNGQGLKLEVFSLTGSKVATVAIDANDKSVTLNVARGLYIIRVGNVTRKVTIS